VLNTTLASINSLFLAEIPAEMFPYRERLFIADALLLDLA
jgi:hypothetical protein